MERQWNIVNDFFTETIDDFKESMEAEGKNVGKVGAEAWGDQVFHLWSRLEEITEPWKGILWAGELYEEEGEGWGCLVNWKKKRCEVGRMRCHSV